MIKNSKFFLLKFSPALKVEKIKYDPLRKEGGINRRFLASFHFFGGFWLQIGRCHQNKTFLKQTPLVLGQLEVANYEKNIFKALFCIFRAKIVFEVTLDTSKEVLLPSLQYYGLLLLEVLFWLRLYVWVHNFWLGCRIDIIFILRVALCLKIIFHTHNMLLRRPENFI